MIECIFTLDYEIYGNGTGALQDLVYEPARELAEVFLRHDARFVAFVEAAELEKIEEFGTDSAIDSVKSQLREFHSQGFEIGLHLHPQWCNACHDGRQWFLDYREYNLCALSLTRIEEIVAKSIDYLRHVIDWSQFTPLSFRAGNWLFQPTKDAARVLFNHGIRIDSSVFKGGLQHNLGLDYRGSMRNGDYWRFSRDVNVEDASGPWLEVPIHSEMVPLWRMATTKRLGLQGGIGIAGQSASRRLNRLRDFLRLRYPLKLDFCRMTIDQMTSMLERVIGEDQKQPATYRPIVLIGHTKDLCDLQSVEDLLSFLRAKGIAVSTFESVYSRLSTNEVRPASLGQHACVAREREPVKPAR